METGEPRFRACVARGGGGDGLVVLPAGALDGSAMSLWRMVSIGLGLMVLAGVVLVVAWALIHGNDMPSTFA